LTARPGATVLVVPGLRSGTGRPRKRIQPRRSPRQRWPQRSSARATPRIGTSTCSSGGGGSWRTGLSTSQERDERRWPTWRGHLALHLGRQTNPASRNDSRQFPPPLSLQSKVFTPIEADIVYQLMSDGSDS